MATVAVATAERMRNAEQLGLVEQGGSSGGCEVDAHQDVEQTGLCRSSLSTPALKAPSKLSSYRWSGDHLRITIEGTVRAIEILGGIEERNWEQAWIWPRNLWTVFPRGPEFQDLAADVQRHYDGRARVWHRENWTPDRADLQGFLRAIREAEIGAPRKRAT